MTRDEAKLFLPIIQAYADGKQIQCKTIANRDKWTDVSENCYMSFEGSPEIYRIAPEKKYRPFASAEEFAPYREIWIKPNSATALRLRVYAYNDEVVCYTENNASSYQQLFDCYKFDDGTPCGIEVAE